MGDIMTVAQEVGSGKKKKKEDERRKHTLHTEIYQPTSAILLSILHTFVDPPSQHDTRVKPRRIACED